MERLGTPDRLGQGLLVVRVESAPEIGTEVVDGELDVVGTVVDVFGPISRPFAAVSPTADCHPPSLLGSPLYVR